jgi:hypothetical protein
VRNKSSLLVVGIVVAITLSITGQEEPLPVVQAKATTPPPMLVALAVEPIHTFEAPTLADAARANDYRTFDALYGEAKARGESVAAFDTLHEVWAWSMSDPIGAFYGPDLYARLARAYPGFARYIDEYRIVDNRGNVFYPTSETRAFLLDRALEGRATPRVLVASAPRSTEQSASESSQARPLTRRSAAPSLRRAGRGATKTQPVAEAPAPVAEAPVANPPITQPIVEAPIIVKADEAAPQVVPATAPVPAPQPAVVKDGFANRGILLLVIGLVGIGWLAVILRTPQEAPATILPTAQVEPFRKTPDPESAKAEETAAKPRATGSHG